MPPDRPDGDALDGVEQERLSCLLQARELLANALELLDAHGRSPAAANVDLAIHQINAELSGRG